LEAADIALIQGRLRTLPLKTPSKYSSIELNYLNEAAEPGAPSAEDEDLKLWAGLLLLRSELTAPIDPRVLAQYDESFALFNAMREQLNRYKVQPPELPR
jgi:hypothetical protein